MNKSVKCQQNHKNKWFNDAFAVNFHVFLCF
jgi:hypothetical protein